MRLRELSSKQLSGSLRGAGLSLICGPFVFRISSPFPAVAEGLAALYANHATVSSDEFADFSVDIVPPLGVRRWLRAQARFYFEGMEPFQPLPAAQAYPMLEWALNWCIASHAHRFLILHAAVVERGGRALVLPGPPGAGKSTLCAGLVARGWRLLSDELTLIGVGDTHVSALARPISLKNESIDVIRRFAPAEVVHTAVHDTAKGTIAQMKPPPDSVRRIAEPASSGWVVFPRYEAGAPASLVPRRQGDTMLALARNGFNYGLLERDGFDCLARFVDASECYDFTYGDLAEAVRVLRQL